MGNRLSFSGENEMKIKCWLLLSYVVVMILPLLALYLFYISIERLDENHAFEEHLNVITEMQSIEIQLENPDLYQFNSGYHSPLEALINEEWHISLYNAEGFVIFSTDSIMAPINRVNEELLFRDLYELRRGHRVFTLKKPVFDDGGQLIGFYEIMVPRQEWLTGLENRKAWVFAGTVSTLALIFGGVVIFLNRKLNLPLAKLMEQMRHMATNLRQGEISHKSKDEIGEVIEHFELMKEELREAKLQVNKEQEERENMIAAISHDLKIPLTSIRAYSETLKQQFGEASKIKNHLEIVLSKADYMSQMIDDLNTYVLLRSSEYELDRVEVDGEEFFEMLISGYEQWCSQEGISLTTEMNISGKYKVDVKQMIRVVDNLMNNAIRHTPRGKKIWLAVQEGGEGVPDWIFEELREEFLHTTFKGALILVQNEGPTIEKREVDMVLQPFYQGETSRSKDHKRNTGLGLSITKMILHKHKGELHFLPCKNRGSLLVAWIPDIKEQ
ncbi:HAMP domain-containing sensor histidine kinase [Dethiobacter alkaliphilus]|uniref:HAMP domain-containing sensor histidine kinase n=1 Tax=Dethiobacter alkaliphilus TaxID=427926 RepID=UPI002227956E|nr:HAMP domain-containing sensor histidine kinase [Dethiobacter alkaliphilus]MCW3490388.1 HAMP domain-containing histidine kinase [Dethiobacter alkaliphilus]